MVFKIGVTIQKKVFTAQFFEKKLKRIEKCVFIYHQFVKKK